MLLPGPWEMLQKWDLSDILALTLPPPHLNTRNLPTHQPQPLLPEEGHWGGGTGDSISSWHWASLEEEGWLTTPWGYSTSLTFLRYSVSGKLPFWHRIWLHMGLSVSLNGPKALISIRKETFCLEAKLVLHQTPTPPHSCSLDKYRGCWVWDSPYPVCCSDYRRGVGEAGTPVRIPSDALLADPEIEDNWW